MGESMISIDLFPEVHDRLIMAHAKGRKSVNLDLCQIAVSGTVRVDESKGNVDFVLNVC